MTGYPGDEHVFCVVGIVLARSPDCNLRSFWFPCVSAAQLHCACDSIVCSTFSDLVDLCCRRLCVCATLFEPVRVRQLIPNRHSTKLLLQLSSGQQFFTTGFGARLKVPKASILRVATGVETTSESEQIWNNKREKKE